MHPLGQMRCLAVPLPGPLQCAFSTYRVAAPMMQGGGRIGSGVGSAELAVNWQDSPWGLGVLGAGSVEYKVQRQPSAPRQAFGPAQSGQFLVVFPYEKRLGGALQPMAPFL